MGQMKPLTFHASVKGTSTDEDGQAIVRLKIPLSDMGAALVLATRIKKILTVTIVEAPPEDVARLLGERDP